MGLEYDSRDMELATAAAAAAFAIQALELQYQRKMRKKEDSTKNVAPSKKHSKSHTVSASASASASANTRERKTLEGAFRGGSNPSPSPSPSKADDWEKTQIQKITKWNEKMTSTIISWEREKKERAKRQMERRKGELERSKARNMQHYQHKIANIENVAGGAIVQMEERTASKQSEVKDKANKMRNLPAQTQTYCFCF